MLWKKHNGFLNHQNKLTFAAIYNGSRTRTRLLFHFGKSADKVIFFARPFSLSPLWDFSVRKALAKTLSFFNAFYLSFLYYN